MKDGQAHIVIQWKKNNIKCPVTVLRQDKKP